jgi:uncharacterized membrane protein YhiD involved in acid resistance
MHREHGKHSYNDLMRWFDANSVWRKSLFTLAFLALVFALAVAQQTPQLPRQVPTTPGQAASQGDENDNDSMARRTLELQAMRRNSQRQQDIVNDTNKLLDLAQQLKAEVDKSSKDQLSISVVKKAEEIEKLAKSVKEKMKGS